MTRPRFNGIGALFALVATISGASVAQEADASRQEVGRELGSVLAWRLMPAIVESKCREADPAGADVRRQALQAWLDKNANLIKSVDERVAEVAPLAFKAKEGVDAVQLIRRQVGGIVEQSLFGGKSPDELATICKAEANPSSSRWNSNGMPHVANALAALYDWKVQHTAK